MQSLPPELLSHILLFTFPKDRQRWSIGNVRTLALVCRRWRDLVVESPLFWPLISTSDSLETANLVLKYNPTGPLDVDLNRSNGIGWQPHDYPLTEYIIRHQALSHVSRWRHVKILNYDFSPEMMSIIEGAQSAESLFLRFFFKSTVPLINLRHFARLQHLQLDDILIDWTNLPQLPFLRVLQIESVPPPEIGHLHVLFGSAPLLDSITFRDLRDHNDSEHRWDKSGQPISGLLPVSLTALTRLELRKVHRTGSSVFQNHDFHQLATHALVGSVSVRVCVNVDTMFVTGVHIKSKIAKDRTKKGGLDANFIMPKFDEWHRVFRGFGAIIGSKLISLQIGVLKGIRIADFVETLKSAPNILPSVRTIQIIDAHASLILLTLLSREYLDTLGEATWLAPGLEKLILPRSGAVDNKSIMYALEQLWLKRYARLEIYPNGCSRLRRLVCGNGDLVAEVRKDGLFSGTAVDVYVPL